MFTTSCSNRFLRQLLALSTVTFVVSSLAQNAGDYRSAASGNWNVLTTWETYDGANWVAASATPTAANAGVITIQSAHQVTNSAALQADQVIVASGGTLALTANLTAVNGAGVDLDVSGTLLAFGGSSVVTLQASTELVVRSGGLFIHSGTSGACVNNTSATVTFENGARFLMQRSGATVPTATWNSGSTCEINYTNVSTSRPNGLGQVFANFHWNNTNQNAGNDLANTLLNVAGNLTINAGPLIGVNEFKLYNASGTGSSSYSNITVNAGRLNWASGGGPYVWTVRGNLEIKSGTSMDVSGSSSGSYTLFLDSGGVQNYTCAGANIATKLNWSITNGTTLNLNDDLPLTAAGRTLTANGIVNVNGKIVSTDLVAGTGTIRNEGGGNGTLIVGAGNGNNTLDGTLALLDGASGSLGLNKRGSGSLSITAAQTFSGGLVLSNGTVLVSNTTGSGTGSGAVAVYGGTLGGNGIISGAITMNGGTLSPGASIGKLTINNTLTLAGNALIEVDKANGTNDQIFVTTANYGGTLTVTDLGGGLIAGDTFAIFTAGSHTGDFSNIVGSPGPNLNWQFNPTNGVLSVVGTVVNPPTLLYSQTGSTLTLSWTEPGFKLQSQTNTITTGISTNWGDYPDLSNPVNVAIDPVNGAVFFRLSSQ